MNQDNEYLATSLWYKEEITDPYQVIAECFSNDDIASYRRYNKNMLSAAHSQKIYDKTSPGDLMFHFKILESVINAAFLIEKEHKQSPLNIENRDAFNKNLYCGWHANLTEWDFFPRTLSFKEYCNPYLVFGKFFRFQPLQQWKHDLEDILEYALVKTSLHEASIILDELSLYFYLTKLLEAAHLIDVREINHIGGFIKNRIR